jgi:hypothetical protein
MLTPKELRQVSCAALISEAIASTLTGVSICTFVLVVTSTKVQMLTAVTSTKVQMLTAVTSTKVQMLTAVTSTKVQMLTPRVHAHRLCRRASLWLQV